MPFSIFDALQNISGSPKAPSATPKEACPFCNSKVAKSTWGQETSFTYACGLTLVALHDDTYSSYGSCSVTGKLAPK